MKINDIVRILLIADSQNDAEETTSLFRNGGYPTRGHRVESAAELAQLIGEEEWDLLIADADYDPLSLATAMATLLEEQQDLPVIALSGDCTAARPAALAAGVREVITRGDHPHLLHAALREVRAHRLQRESQQVQATLEELQARYELLMGGSQDAIAYITDGMHVDVNEAYASQFGYADPDDLACMPVIDLIAPADQDKFKQFIKGYSQQADESDGATLDIVAQSQGGEEIPLQMRFAPASYEGEHCTQIIIRAGGGAGNEPSPREFLADMAQQLVQCRRQGQGFLTYLQLANLADLQRELGVMAAENITSQLSTLLKRELPQLAIHGRVTADGYAVMSRAGDAQEGHAEASRLLEAIRSHYFEVDGRSARCECSAATVGLHERSPDSIESLIDQAHRGLLEMLDSGPAGQATLYTPPAAPIQLGCGDIDLDELYEEGRLQLRYQPIVSLRGDAGEYYEVQAVLEEKNTSCPAPAELAAAMLSESKGSLFDRWLIFATTKRLAIKRAQGNDTRLIVNITPACLRDQELANWLAVSLNAAGLPPEAVILQLDEAAAKTSIKQTERFFRQLKQIGCTTSLGRFGKLPDSAEVLRHCAAGMVVVRANTLENGLLDDAERQALKRALNDAVDAGATTIVTNVSSAATLATLWQLGAGFIQGAYLQEPTPDMEYEFAEIA